MSLANPLKDSLFNMDCKCKEGHRMDQLKYQTKKKKSIFQTILGTDLVCEILQKNLKN